MKGKRIMGKVIVELVFILDRSGSMKGLETETIGGYNAMIEKQKKQEGKTLVTTILFNNEYQRLTFRTPIKEVRPLTGHEYFPRGRTALLDAIGQTIHQIALKQKEDEVDRRPTKTVFVIITDGLENASTHFTTPIIKEMISYEEREYGWEFMFLGANFEVFSVTDQLGIRRTRAARYARRQEAVYLNYSEVGNTINRMRRGEAVGDEWKENIDALFDKKGDE